MVDKERKNRFECESEREIYEQKRTVKRRETKNRTR